MMKQFIPLFACAGLTMAFSAYADEPTLDSQFEKAPSATISNEQPKTVTSAVESEATIELTEDALWQQTITNPDIAKLNAFLEVHPNGQYSAEAKSRVQALERKAAARAKRDKELEAYRKGRIAGGLVLDLDSKFTDVKPYFRSMLNSCGYTLVEPHRFAKRVYPTLDIDGQMFNRKSEGEHFVTLYLTMALKSKTREVKVREKLTSYRSSTVDEHKAFITAFEDIGAQMKASGFCI